MSEAQQPEMTAGADASAAAADRDSILQLNFVPVWARRPPDTLDLAPGDGADFARPAGRGGDRRDRPERQDRERRGGGRDDARRPRGRGPGGDRNGRDGAGRTARPGAGRPERPARDDAPRADGGAREGARMAGGRHREGNRFERPAPPPRLPLEIRFFPEQRHLSSLIHQIGALKRAYSVQDLAGLLVSKPETCSLKVEVFRNAPADLTLCQCRACGMLATDRALLVQHAVARHLDDYFTREETEVEPPAGQFICVARCGLSGTLLGPPNHHSYAERLAEVHATLYPDMPLDEYRRRIQTAREPEAIEQWKQEARKQITYRIKDKGEGAEPLRRGVARQHFIQTILPGLITPGARRATMGVAAVKTMEDRLLQATLRMAWQRECRQPGSLWLALRAALRHRGLHIFKTPGGAEFVTAIVPNALDPATAIEPIRAVLNHLSAHPGCTRAALLEALRPGTPADAPEAHAVLQPLTWLIAKGNIIEFFDGSLAVPMAAGARAAESPAVAAPAPTSDPAGAGA